MQSELKAYYKQIRNALPAGVCNRRRIMESIVNGIDEYCLHNSDADISQIRAHFGSPEMIAAAYIEDQPADMLLKALHVRKKIVAIVAIVMAVILLSWSAFMVHEIVIDQKIDNGYMVNEIDGIPTQQ